MKFVIEIDKFPLIKFDKDKYAHIFPVTKYQFERYIWESAPNINYNEIIEANPRISPNEANEGNLDLMFLTNLTFEEARGFAEWVGGRLPTKNELDSLNEYISGIKIGEIKNLLEKPENKTFIDERLLNILGKFESMNVKKIGDIFPLIQISEFCCTHAFIHKKIHFDKLYGLLWVRGLNSGSYSEIVGDNPFEVKGTYGFRIILKKKEVSQQ